MIETIEVTKRETLGSRAMIKIREKINEIKANIENYDMDFFINMVVEEQEPYVIALILYKLNYKNICLKKIDHKIIHNKMNARK